MTLDAAARRRFAEDGVLVVPDVFDAARIEALRAAFERLFERGHDLEQTTELDGATFVLAPTRADGRPAIQRVVWCGAAEPELGALGEDPAILHRALDLLGTDAADQLINQAHLKRPSDGVEFPFHQDAWNRRYGTELWVDDSDDGAYVQCVATIDDMHEGNGPLMYVPGSHRLGGLVGEDRDARVAALLEQTPAVPLVVAAGALIFFGPFLVHGSAPNQSAGPRRILINGYARPGVNRRVYPGAGTGVRRVRP